MKIRLQTEASERVADSWLYPEIALYSGVLEQRQYWFANLYSDLLILYTGSFFTQILPWILMVVHDDTFGAVPSYHWKCFCPYI